MAHCSALEDRARKSLRMNHHDLLSLGKGVGVELLKSSSTVVTLPVSLFIQISPAAEESKDWRWSGAETTETICSSINNNDVLMFTIAKRLI